MRKISSYFLENPDVNLICAVTMPSGSEILGIVETRAGLSLRALVTPQNPNETRRFALFTEDNEVPRHARYVATAASHPFVWHAFELLGEPLPEGLNLPENAEDAYRTLTSAGFEWAYYTLGDADKTRRDCRWIAPDDEPLTTELIKAVATLQEHGFGPVVSK